MIGSALVRDLERSLEAMGGLHELIDRFAAEHSLDEDQTFAALLVAEELFANCVRHNRGGGATIRVRLRMHEGLLKLELTDSGVEPFDPGEDAHADVRAPLSERTPGGLGLRFVRRYCDDLSYSCSDGNMTVTATTRVRREDV